MNKKSIKEKLLRPYPKWAMKIRRILFNLYRPIMHDKSNSLFNQHLLAYIMIILFSWSLILVIIDSPSYPYPFLSGWIVIPITWIYFRFRPQTWIEMFEYEKDAFREIWRLPRDWTPS